MNTEKKHFIGTVVLAIVVIGSVIWHYEKKINLYQERLRETMDHIHDLQHEIDPLHQQFNHSKSQKSEHTHDHTEVLDITETNWRPSVSVKLHRELQGVTVELLTNNFAFAPENAGGEHMEGEGHAHLYIDGTKVARVYSDWIYLDLEPGQYEIEVTLNSNNHKSLTLNGRKIADSASILIESR